MLNCISGVDYFEPDPKKAPRPASSRTWRWSIICRASAPAPLRPQGEAAALEGRTSRASCPRFLGHRPLADRRLARTRSLRPCPACGLPAIPTSGASCSRRIGSAIRCARIMSCRWNITEFAGDSSRSWERNAYGHRAAARSDHHRVRRPHRRDARQHGTAASQHPRRAPAGAAHRRRGRLRGRRRTSAICTAAPRRSARTSRRSSSFPTPTAWTTWPG